MCGRFTLSRSGREVAEHFDLAEVPELEPRYNIAPSQAVPVVHRERGPGAGVAPLLDRRRFGLVPGWAKELSIGNRLINARAESVATRPAFRAAIRRRRCLVPADGFFEWQAHPAGKRPHHVTPASGGLLALAGLYEDWSPPQGGDRIHSFALITTEAPPELAWLHDRAPLIVDPPDYAAWLDPEQQDPERALATLGGETLRALTAVRVGTRVNDVGHDDPACLRPDSSGQLSLADF